jgi:lactoylglutathione lyase
MRLVASLALLGAFASAGALAQPAPSGAPAPAFTARVMGIALNVADIEKSLAFYCDALGMKVLGTYDLPNGKEHFVSFGTMGEPMLILVSGRPAAAAIAARPVSYGRVVMRSNDVKLLHARLKASGQPAGEVRDIGSGRQILFVTDPDGYRTEFVSGL